MEPNQQQQETSIGPTTRAGYRNYTLPGGFTVRKAPENATQFDLVYSFYKTSGEGKERARRLAQYNKATLTKEAANRQQYEDLIRRELANYPELDPELILRQVQVESTFNPLALSEAGAMGLMQLTEIHWGKGEFNPLDPEQNVKAGLAYLYKHYKEHKGDYAKAFAAYHSGQTDVRKWIRKYGTNWRQGLGQDGRRYLRDILGTGTTSPRAENITSNNSQPQNTNYGSSLGAEPPSLEPDQETASSEQSSLDRQVTNLSIGVGQGVTEQLQSAEDFIRNPQQVARETLQQFAALYDDPRLALEMLREVGRKAASGPLGMGEVIGSLVPLRVPSGRKPTMQEVNEPVDMTKRREKQIADEEEKEFRQYSSTLSDMKTLSLLERFQQNQPAIENLYRQHELIQKLRDIPLSGLHYVNDTLNKWERFSTELVKGINNADAFHLNNADFIYRDSNFSKEFNKYISSVLEARERLNPRSPKDRKIIKQIDDILGSDRITPIK